MESPIKLIDVINIALLGMIAIAALLGLSGNKIMSLAIQSFCVILFTVFNVFIILNDNGNIELSFFIYSILMACAFALTSTLPDNDH